MAIANANALRILAFNDSTGTKVPVAHAQTAALSFSNALIDITTKSSNAWAEKISGQKGFTLSTDGLLDYETTAGESNANTLAEWAGASGATPTKVFFDFGIGAVAYSGSGYIASLEQSGGTDDAPTYSMSVDSDGELAFA